MQPTTLFAGLATLLATVQARPGAAVTTDIHLELTVGQQWQSVKSVTTDGCTATLMKFPTKNTNGYEDGAQWKPQINCMTNKHKTARAVMDLKGMKDLQSSCVGTNGGVGISQQMKWLPLGKSPRNIKVQFNKC